MIRTDYFLARKLGEFKKFASRLNKMIRSGAFYLLSGKKRNMLLSRIARLYKQLLVIEPKVKLRHILAGAATLVLSLGASDTSGQTFGPRQVNPFGITNTITYFAHPAAADFDADGDIDIMAGGYPAMINYLENTGSSASPNYAAPQPNAFSLTPGNISFPTAVDIDADGDVDLIIGGYPGTIDFFENTGTASAPNFKAPVATPFGLTTVQGYALPTFADIDNDGDLDAFIGEYYGNIQYFENTGSASSPSFGLPQMNPFGLPSGGGYIAIPVFGDLDGDGDYDLMVTGNYGDFAYYENTGTAANPSFGSVQLNAFGLFASPALLLGPNFVDLDNDGDLDLLLGDVNGAHVYYENTYSPLCPSPIYLTTSNATTTTVNLDWTSSNSGATYTLEWGIQGFTPGTGTIITGTSLLGTNTKIISGLTSGIFYEFYVQENCSGNLSEDVGPASFTPLLQNDECAGAIPITCGTIVQLSTVGTAVDTAPSCGSAGDGTGGGIWYSIVGNGSTMKASLCGSAYDTQIRVYTGSCTSLICETGNDDFCGLQSEVTWNSVSGVTYSILVHGWGSEEGDFTLNMCDGVIGLEDSKELSDIKLFPNPANDQITIQLPGSLLAESMNLEIFDAMGRTIYREVCSLDKPGGTLNRSVDISDFSRGVYFASIRVGNQVFSQKFIVE